MSDITCPVCGSTNIICWGDNDYSCLDGPHRWNQNGEQHTVP